jgi:hypothetical protein
VRTHPADAIDLLGCVICAHQFLFIISNFAFWKGGRPVCIERTGRINSKKLCNVHKSLMTAADPSPIFTAHLHSVEVGRALMRYNNSKRAAGSDEVTQVTVIMDVAGLGMHTLYPPALALLRANGASKNRTEMRFRLGAVARRSPPLFIRQRRPKFLPRKPLQTICREHPRHYLRGVAHHIAVG